MARYCLTVFSAGTPPRNEMIRSRPSPFSLIKFPFISGIEVLVISPEPPIITCLARYRTADATDPTCAAFIVDKDSGETTDARTPVEFLREHIEWLGLIIPEVF